MDQTPSTFEIAAEPGAVSQEISHKSQRIAPIWHTVLLAIFLLVTSLAGANSQHDLAKRGGKEILYGITIAMEWVMVGYIWLGTRRRLSLRDLIGGRWNSVEAVLLDVALGIAALFFIYMVVMLGLGLALRLVSLHPEHNAQQLKEAKETLGFMLPSTGVQVLLFMVLSATAGFCEEVIYRGYFQRQFSAFTGTVVGGLVIQAVLFGASHAYEGWKRMIIIGAEALVFGAIVLWRKSLRPGMVAHFSQDAIGGLLGRVIMRSARS